MRIGIITGSGTYALPGLEAAAPRELATSFGPALVSEGRLGGADVLHVSRHQEGHRLLSSAVTHQANLAALRDARRGRDPRRHRLRRARPRARARLAPRLRRPALPLEPPARRLAVHAAHRARRPRARALGLRPARSAGPCAPRCWRPPPTPACAVRDGGCYGHVDGPRFNTRTEIAALRRAGVTAVSQTAGPRPSSPARRGSRTRSPATPPTTPMACPTSRPRSRSSCASSGSRPGRSPASSRGPWRASTPARSSPWGPISASTDPAARDPAAIVVAGLGAPADPSLDAALGEDGARRLRAALAARARRWAAAAAPGRAWEATSLDAAGAALAAHGHDGPVLLAAPDVPGLDAALVADVLGDLADGVLVTVGASHDGSPYLVGLARPDPRAARAGDGRLRRARGRPRRPRGRAGPAAQRAPPGLAGRRAARPRWTRSRRLSWPRSWPRSSGR